MGKIVFFVAGISKTLLHTVEYYRQDIQTLQSLGHEVIPCTKYREIPKSFDALFIWWWTYAAVPVVFARILRKPSIITGTYNFRYTEKIDVNDYFSRPFYHKFLIKWATQYATMNVFVNKLEWESCSEYFQLENSKYCPHSINKDCLQGPGSERELALLNIAWSGKKNLLRKGIPDLIDAMKIVHDTGIHIKLYLAGHRGDGFEMLQQKIADAQLQEQVILLGEITAEEKLAYLRRCELYVQPSYYEGFGLAQAEAMGSGACVITCKVGAVEEVVGDAGVYVKPGNPQELASAIQSIVDNKEERQRLQKEGFERVRNLFSHEKKIEMMRNYLQEVGITSPRYKRSPLCREPKLKLMKQKKAIYSSKNK